MAFNFGQFTEFSDTVTAGDPIIEAVAKVIDIGPFTGKFYESMGAPSVPLTQKEFEIYNRTVTSRDGTIDANWDSDDTTGLGISDNSLKGITVGHVLNIDGEIVIVSAVNRTSGTISVLARGAGSSTAASHTSGASFQVVGYAGTDTDLKNVESVNEGTTSWKNYVQTVFETIDWTKHAELIRKGLDSASAIQVLVREAEIRVAKMLARMAIHGVKAQAGSTERYMSAGLIQQLDDVTNRGARRYNVNGNLTEEKFKAALKDAFDNGAMPNTIWCSTSAKAWLNSFLGANSSVVYTDTANNHVGGGYYIDSYNYEGAILKIRVDADMPSDKIAIVNQAKCKKAWLENDGLRMCDEPSQSSREFRKSLQGSIGFLIEDVGSDHTLLYGITGGESERTYKAEVSSVGSPVATYAQITVNADADVPTAAAANIGMRVLIGTAWTSGTKIATAVKGEIYASSGAAWIKQA